MSARPGEGRYQNDPSIFAKPDLSQWFALRVKSNFENITALHLKQRGYEQFLPQYSEERRWSDRLKRIEKPLFPGYVFCRFDPNQRLPIITTPGVLCIVGSGNRAAAIDDAEMAAVRAAAHSGLPVRPCAYVGVGERVVIFRGPLRGVEGFVTAIKGAYRFVVSVNLLQRSIAVEVESDWIRRVADHGHGTYDLRGSGELHRSLEI